MHNVLYQRTGYRNRVIGDVRHHAIALHPRHAPFHRHMVPFLLVTCRLEPCVLIRHGLVSRYLLARYIPIWWTFALFLQRTSTNVAPSD